MITKKEKLSIPLIYRPSVGDRVSFRYVLHNVIGTITEDRGPIGVGGRRLYEITAPRQWEDPLVIELPAEKFTPLD